MSKEDNNIIMGRIGAAHGIKGSIRVKSFTANALDLGAYGALFDKNGNSYNVKNIRPQKTMVIVKFNEITTREMAEKLNGVELFIERNKLPENLSEEEFYTSDLVGLNVFDMSDKLIGKIIDMPNFGAGDLIEIAPIKIAPIKIAPVTEGASFDDKTYYLEFNKNIVPIIDLKNQLIKINPPIEINEKEFFGENEIINNEVINDQENG